MTVERGTIRETRTTNRVSLWFSRRVLGDAGLDLYIKYDIPDVLNDRLQTQGDVSVLLQGKRDNLRVTVETSGGAYVLNTIAPKGTKFSVRNPFNGLVETAVDKKTVMIPVGREAREVLPYAILHGIARLELHKDQAWHKTSTEAHALLNAQLSHLATWGKVPRPTSPEEVHAWEVLGEEERKTSKLTLALLRDVRNLGIDPLPYVRNLRDLTRLVNSNKVQRTLRQIHINPKWTGQQIEISMTLPESSVTAFMK